MSGVCQNIDTPPPHPLASVYPPPPPLVRGRTHSLGEEGVGGHYFGRRPTLFCSLYSTYTCKYFVVLGMGGQEARIEPAGFVFHLTGGPGSRRFAQLLL
jgi:hypothetical protein